MSWLHNIIVSLGTLASSLFGYNHPATISAPATTSPQSVQTVGSVQKAVSTKIQTSSSSTVSAIPVPPAALKAPHAVAVAGFYSDAGKFSVRFPGTPELSTSTQYIVVSPYTSYSYRYADGDHQAFYMATYLELPNGLDFSLNAKGTASGAFPEMLISIAGVVAPDGGQIVSSKEGTYLGYPSDDYMLYSKNNDFYMKCRTVLNKGKQYTVIFGYKNDADANKNEAIGDAFLDSLQLF